MNFVVRKGKFDAGHRVMYERFKCFNVHGHEYHYELKFYYEGQLKLGYAIDFKEIKRVACEWIDSRFDHSFISNPMDIVMVEACKSLKSKLYTMHLVDEKGFCNPSAENIAKEIFFAVGLLLDDSNLKLTEVSLHETVNCRVICNGLTQDEIWILSGSELNDDCVKYRSEKGSLDYDSRHDQH